MFSNVCDLNNRGVTLLREGCRERAFECFYQALQNVESIIESSEGFTSLGSNNRPSLIIEGIDVNVDDTESFETNTSPNNPFLIYRRAFVLIPGQRPHDPNACPTAISRIDSSLAYASIVFNIAAMCHRAAFSKNFATSTQRASYLISKAAGLYSNAISMLPRKEGTNCSSTFHLIVCATLNNLSQIYAENNRNEGIRICSKHLEELLCSGQLSLHCTDYFFFFVNVTISQCTDFHFAPVA